MWCLAVAVVLMATAPLQARQDEAANTPAPANPPVAEAAAPVPEGLASPRATITTFMRSMSADPIDYAAAVSCLQLEGVTNDAAIARQLALQLDDIVDLVTGGSLQALTSVPASADTIDTYDLFPRNVMNDWQLRRVLTSLASAAPPDAKVELVRTAAGTWLFSAATLNAVSDLAEAVRQVRKEKSIESSRPAAVTLAGWVESNVPEVLMGEFLFVRYWQWIALFTLIFVGFVLDLVVRLVIRIAAGRLVRALHSTADAKTVKRTVRPFGLCAAALFWIFMLPTLMLPLGALRFLVPAAQFFATLACVWAAYRVTDLIAEAMQNRASRTDNKLDDLLVPLLRKTVKVFVTAFGLIYIAESLDIQLAPLLAGLGIGGLGFAFAAKDTIENFFGSVTVILDQPFQVGDWIVVDGVEGTVEQVGFRSTRVRTFYNSQVTLANATLVRATVDNYGRRRFRRWNTKIGLAYETSPEQIDAFCEGVREILRLHPYTRKDYYQVWLNEWGESSLNVLLYVFWVAPDWQTELRERHRFMLDVLRLAGRLQIEIAYPTRTLYMRPDGPDAPKLPTELQPGSDEATTERAGRDAVRAMTEESPWRRERPGAYRFTSASDEAMGDSEHRGSSADGGE